MIAYVSAMVAALVGAVGIVGLLLALVEIGKRSVQ